MLFLPMVSAALRSFGFSRCFGRARLKSGRNGPLKKRGFSPRGTSSNPIRISSEPLPEVRAAFAAVLVQRYLVQR